MEGRAVAQLPGVEDSNGATALVGPYRAWIEEDVRWIILPDELSSYLALKSDHERMQFIEKFWERRNPESGGGENKFKEEHYRRLAYSNQHFAAKGPGWRSDRGRVYIVYGKPDSIDAHPSAGVGGTHAFEVWHYAALHANGALDAAPPGAGARNADLNFVDTCNCGEYKLSPMP